MSPRNPDRSDMYFQQEALFETQKETSIYDDDEITDVMFLKKIDTVLGIDNDDDIVTDHAVNVPITEPIMSADNQKFDIFGSDFRIDSPLDEIFEAIIGECTRRTEITIRPNDVLIGQSPNLRNHPGNQELRRLIEGYAPEYFHKKTKKRRKTEISVSIVQTIRGNGGSFLRKKHKDAEWEEEDTTSRQCRLVASRFRGLKKCSKF